MKFDESIIDEMNALLDPVKEKERKVSELSSEQAEVKKAIEELEMEIDDKPSFSKTLELTNMKNSYESFSKQVEQRRKDFYEAEKAIDKPLRKLANKALIEAINKELAPHVDQTEIEIVEEARKIVEASQKLRETVSSTLKEFEESLKKEVRFEKYLDRNNDYDRYPDYRFVESKALHRGLEEDLINIKERFNKFSRGW